MPLSQLLDLVVNERLWIPSLRLLQQIDPYEGILEEELLKEYVKRSPSIRSRIRPGDDDDRKIDFEIHGIYGEFKSRSERAFASCWHIRSHETFVMWRSYGQFDTPVAIKTSAVRLISALKVDHFFPHITCGRMIYRSDDPDVDYASYGDFLPLFLKRRHFEEEREFRVVVEDSFPEHLARYNGVSLPDGYKSAFDRDPEESMWEATTREEQAGGRRGWNGPAGLYLGLDLPTLLDSVLVKPDAPGWVVNTLRRLFEMKGLDPSIVVRSGLGAQPDFYSLREPIKQMINDPKFRREAPSLMGYRRLPFKEEVLNSTVQPIPDWAFVYEDETEVKELSSDAQEGESDQGNEG